MTPEKKSGIISLLIGIIGLLLIIFLSKSAFITYLGLALFFPFIVFGVGISLNPNTRRKKIGQLPFRGW